MSDTMVLVTDVPMLAPITMGMACRTLITDKDRSYSLIRCVVTTLLQSDPTIVTTIEVDVDEDWTRTVTRTPIMRPTIGF